MLLRNPITGIAGCCARATSGPAIAAPPSSVMNSRRLTYPQGKGSRDTTLQLFLPFRFGEFLFELIDPLLQY